MCVTLEAMWSHGTWIDIKLSSAYAHQHPVQIQQFFKSTLVAFSLTLFAYVSKRNLQPSINFFITNVYNFIHRARKKVLTIYKQGVKQVITKEYKGRIFNDYVKVVCVFYTSIKSKTKKTLRVL